MLTRTAQYALQVLGYLTTTSLERARGEEIARATGIPRNYLSKVLNQLRKQGLVHSEKGWGGGFWLCEDAREKPIAEVLEIIEGKGYLGDGQCGFRKATCSPERPCPLHPYWGRIRATYEEMLRETHVGDLTGY